jgi:hypothetical protein
MALEHSLPIAVMLALKFRKCHKPQSYSRTQPATHTAPGSNIATATLQVGALGLYDITIAGPATAITIGRTMSTCRTQAQTRARMGLTSNSEVVMRLA